MIYMSRFPEMVRFCFFFFLSRKGSIKFLSYWAIQSIVHQRMFRVYYIKVLHQAVVISLGCIGLQCTT